MFHDLGKPQTFSTDEKGIGHFYSHAIVSAEQTQSILRRMKFDNKTIDAVSELVKYHDAQMDTTKKSVKRWLHKIGQEQLERLLWVKEADVKTTVYAQEKMHHIQQIRDALSVVLAENACFSLKDLAISGNDLISLGISEGKLVGTILQTILDLVIDGALSNQKEDLLAFAAQEYKKIS